MNDINYYGKTIYYIIVYLIVITAIIIIIDEIYKMTIFTYNYTYNYNYGKINENLCKNDNKTGIIEYEKARFRVFNNLNKYKFENDLFNKNWINYITFIIIVILTIISCIMFGTIFYYLFIDKILNCTTSFDDLKEEDMSTFKLLIKCMFGDLHKFIPNCSLNYFLLFIIVVYYPIIIIIKSFFNIDYVWNGGFWSKSFNIFISILLVFYIIYLLKDKSIDDNTKTNKISAEDKYLNIMVYVSFISIFYISLYIHNNVCNENTNQFKPYDIYNKNENVNDVIFFDIYKQQEPIKPIKPKILIDLPREDSTNKNLLESFKYCTTEELEKTPTIPTYCGATKATYIDNLNKINNYYSEKEAYEKNMKKYMDKYNIYKHNNINFPQQLNVITNIMPQLLGFDKNIYLFIYIIIAIFVLIYAILNFYNSKYTTYYYNSIIIYLIGLISICILSNSILTFNTLFNKYHIYEPLSYYKYDILKINTLFDLLIKNDTPYLNKLDFYKEITTKQILNSSYDSTVTTPTTTEDDVIYNILNTTKYNTSGLLDALTPISPTGAISVLTTTEANTKSTATNAINAGSATPALKTAMEAAIIARDTAILNLKTRIHFIKITNAIHLGLLSSLLYLKDINSANYDTTYIATNNNYWLNNNTNNKFEYYYSETTFSLISTIIEATDTRLITLSFKNFIQILKGTAVNNINNIDIISNKILTNIKWLIYSDNNTSNADNILLLNLSGTNLYINYLELLKENKNEKDIPIESDTNKELIKTYNYNLFTINKIISYYNEFLLKVRKLVITFLNNSSVYCNTETVDIDIINKINEYVKIMTKENGTKFKLDTEEPKIKIYKKILQNTISEFNKLYVKYFNIIKYLIFKNIKLPGDKDSFTKNIFNEIKYNYNIYNNLDKYNNEDFIKNKSVNLHCNEFINKYMKLTTKEKEYIDINIDNVSWSFIVLVIIFAIILLEPIII